ncbi:MAG TPA: SDR family NAD(P)-dependent oxidoreductase, partial [Candidatus Acidoferrum sp.]|nr:SDR family NAD(P)-dependent oxidoreductase [Candidatus Acidoferrum sp.]
MSITRKLSVVSTACAALALLLAPLANAETVMITGANSGIGLEFAKEYAKKGWTVVATHRRSEVPSTLADLQKQYGDKIRIEHLDVTNVDEATALATKMKDVPIDVLINNAGVYNDRSKCAGDDDGCPGDWTNQTFDNLNLKLLDTIMAVNIKGPLIVSHAF